ncbi:MAG: putative HAD superfamily hydrolase [Bacteroidetes bacterium]|nr:MAG: putative HAD superfamily hydrolase [Bacteroidota bacterium]
MISTIGFDADDTLWVNEPNYRQTEAEFCRILEPWLPEPEVSKGLFATEMANLELYGYGAKGFILSMIETAIRLSNGTISNEKLNHIIGLGKELLDRDVELLDGVKSVLAGLQGKCRLILATKGDLLDQERKLRKSGLEGYFHHIEIMSDKTENNYKKLLAHLEIQPEEFLMVGNSLKSDILPVLNLGGYGVYVPYHTTWQHEHIEHLPDNPNFAEIPGIKHLPGLLEKYEIGH